MGDLFDSYARSARDLAGVFEYDGETAYFYLYSTVEGGEAPVLDAIHLLPGPTDLCAEEIRIVWDESEDRVALFIKGQAWAIFDTSAMSKEGGGYVADRTSPLDGRGFRSVCTL